MTTASRIHQSPNSRRSSIDTGFDSVLEALIKKLRTYEPLLSPLIGVPEQKLWEIVSRKAPTLDLEPKVYEELRRLRVVLESLEATHARASNDRALDAARERASTIKNELIAKGELVSAEDLGRALGVSRQAIHKGAKVGRYFSVDAGREHYFPIFFSDPDLREKGLADVLAILSGESGWSKWLFLTKGSGALGGLTPIEALRKNKLEETMTAARAHIER